MTRASAKPQEGQPATRHPHYRSHGYTVVRAGYTGKNKSLCQRTTLCYWKYLTYASVFTGGRDRHVMKPGFQGVLTPWTRVSWPRAGQVGGSGPPEEDQGTVVGAADLALHGRDQGRGTGAEAAGQHAFGLSEQPVG